ncbi:tetraacyldisaccharide 4'-kinase [Limnohabitans sp. TS-CS-82]|uniref:tetraacyldisaccharide 4'-kinase n=1 Tax=Limnohabitans sp. TS-CS-82 TaxID=2094193 RepID=UPI000CF25BD0|nr:tetraacyldisaccharide 4'-kinase [Limnohabitans sp. TS-CS-82]PQA81478.1 tetraacyldisaccharide 4'-kinase [Limnohabitans sp. TS-CS-82]
MSVLRHALMRAWLSQRGPDRCLALALWPISAVLGALVWLRHTLYKLGVLKQHVLPVPVLVVGNVLVGGVGKTPIVMALVQHLTQQGWRVGVLSRGYGRQRDAQAPQPDIRPVLPDSAAQDVGDEPLLIARTCQVPVWVGSNRTAAGLALLKQHPAVQVLVCDDGLQHWPLARDLELCVFDERGVGNGFLLPAGPLREPWPRSPWRHPTTGRDVPMWVVQTSGPTPPGAFAVTRELASFARQADGTQRALQSWAHTPVQALAGIAKPEVFFDMLRRQGLQLAHTQALPDHADVRGLALNPAWGDVLCTEKDAVKIWAQHPQAWAVPLVTELPNALLHAIDAALQITQRPKLSSPHGH